MKAMRVPYMVAAVVVVVITAAAALAASGAQAHVTGNDEQMVQAIDWAPVQAVLEAAVEDGAFPGCVAGVGTRDGFVFLSPVGAFTYGDLPPLNSAVPDMVADTRFDAASVTKVVSTTSAVMRLYQDGLLDLDAPVTRYLGKAYGVHGKAPIKVLNLMLHNAGYPPDPDPNYWMPAFGCPETAKYHPAENWSCQDKIFAGLLNQTLINPVGQVYVYSDLSMITAMYVVGSVAKAEGIVTPADLIPGCDQGGPGALQCYYEAYVAKHVFGYLGMSNSGFLPRLAEWPLAAPTENDTTYLHRVIQGQVSDGNAYALGGISGHAGLFLTVPDAYILMHRLMFATADDVFANATTVKFFTTVYNVSQSSRAIGWDTNNYQANTIRSCANLSSDTYLHLGYTGTQICNDPQREIFTFLFTNRVYPTALNIKIRQVRQLFNNAVVAAWDAVHPPPPSASGPRPLP
ncbi:beta-lactamase [Thecamonas trahens ATCC 50062]|uniref:Beta-lactamase n=1 Tax=Thecamonas trahens ATCC 50062 TaxID=461836 RepID=A0A0L0DAK2_THETB|nr:beta-lactamase [Thecamonas trahens ATCC 50062]KNC49372.1 beta-lactamase [Thecamonas trahens ATCC 50062]|eukprot:XP_013757797.1 beta-lactamase [Thecamonas trahens ATCC 50062]